MNRLQREGKRDKRNPPAYRLDQVYAGVNIDDGVERGGIQLPAAEPRHIGHHEEEVHHPPALLLQVLLAEIRVTAPPIPKHPLLGGVAGDIPRMTCQILTLFLGPATASGRCNP
ncbi:hypothetical protein ES703_94408 [subsurface metagenome]